MKFTPVIAAGLVAFATAQPARDARVARTPDTGFTVFADEGCAGFRGNPKCQEYAEKCYKDSKNLATKQQVIDCTQAKLKADALGPGGAPSKEQLCAGYLDHPKCREYAQECDGQSKGRLTGQEIVYCTQAKLVGPSLLDKLCVRFGWENRQGCIAKITDCNTKGEVLADCMLPHDEYGIDFPDQD